MGTAWGKDPHTARAPSSAQGSRALQGRMEEPSTDTGWRGLILCHCRSQELQEGSSGLTAPSPMGVLGPILQAPVDVSVSSLSCRAGMWQLPTSDCSQEEKEKCQQTAPSAPPATLSPDAVNFH